MSRKPSSPSVALGACAAAVLSVLPLGCLGADLVIVQDGVPQARIRIAADAPAEVESAANVLGDMIAEASGARLDLVRGPVDAGAFAGVTIHVGATDTEGHPGLLPADMDEDGFVIDALGRDIRIAGPSVHGTAFGVYDFLERFVGVRWLLPGEHGSDVPARATIAVPEGRLADQPVFFSRLYSGLRGAPQAEWARFNRMRGRVSFHHNLIRLFPPERYRESHPEFFPVLQDGGERYLPKSAEDHGWQPCLTAPGIVDEAARTIVQHFNDHPEATSYSLGMNDSGRFCRCESCLVRLSGETNYLGWPDYSDLYYDWCNQIIAKVLEVHPGKWFGCLAYFNVATPPKSVQVHPRLVPYITYDRMKWIDQDLRQAGHEATRQWQACVPAFAWYDYLYGTPYCLPRIYIRHAAEYLRFAAENGVKAHYAEIYPNFGEGPKPYIHLRLWWNPRQDVEALLSEWYERCVGPDAAPFLAEYYAVWERFWTRDILASTWFPKTGTWLPFNNPAYLADVSPADIARSRELLDAAVARTRTAKQKARAELLEKAFQYYEASAVAYRAAKDAAGSPAASEEEALARLQDVERGIAASRKRRRLATEVFANDPVLLHPLGIDRYPAVSGSTWGGDALWAMADWLRGDNAVRRRIEQLAALADSDAVQAQAATLLRVADGHTTVVSRNPSFEEGEGDGAADWWYWRKPDVPPATPVGRIARSRDAARSGEHSLRCDGLLRGGPVQTVDFPGPGKYAAVAWAYVPEGQAPTGTFELHVTPLDEAGKNLPAHAARITPVPGKWTMGIVGLDLPAAIGGRTVTRLRLVPITDGCQDGGTVYWDDVGLHRLD